MFGLKMTGFVEPQSGPIDRHEKRAIPRMRTADGEEPFQFADRENLRPLDHLPDSGQHAHDLVNRSAEHRGIEETQRTGRLVT